MLDDDDNDDEAAAVLPPLVATFDVDSAPSPAVLGGLPTGYGVDVGAGVLDDYK